jgi:hypothetical protein
MSMTSTIIVNAILWVALVASLVWLLGHAGIRRARHHEVRLLRWHSLRGVRRESHTAQ